MTPDRIGFDRFIRLRWLDRTALLAGELRDADALHAVLLQRLAGDIAGKEALRKTVNALTRIWWRVPEPHMLLREEALARFEACTIDERLILNWGMSLLAFPLFCEVTAVVGRLLRLQGVFQQTQLSQRIGADWGHSSTLDTAVPRIVRSLVDWGVLERTGDVGVYRAGQQLTPVEPTLVLWLLEALLLSRGVDLPLNDLLRAAELFPFSISFMAHDLTHSNRLQMYQQGHEMMMVHRVHATGVSGVELGSSRCSAERTPRKRLS